jgi:predicted transposase YdaD
MEHDHSYKLLFSHWQMVADLLRGFVTDDWVRAVDFTTLERVHSSHISTDLREREDDMLWRLQWQHTWLYVYLLLEFQSTVDTYMAVRIQTYVGLLYEGLIRSGQLTPAGRLPPVVPIVLYNGRRQWTAALDVEELVEEMPGGLAVYRPRQPYLLIDETRYSDSELASVQNLAAALFRLENSRTPADVQRVLVALVAWLRDPEHESIRRAFTVWLKRVLLPGRLPTISVPEVQDLMEMQSMLAERVIEWTQQWKEEGLQEGLAAERALLLRQVRKRFGDACAQALAPLLERRNNPEELAEIGEWIVTYDTGEALLAKVRMVS